MPMATRKAKPQAKSYADEDAFEPSDEDGLTFEKVFGNDQEDLDDDLDDFKRKPKPKNRKRLTSSGNKVSGKKRPREPSVPPMSDDEEVRTVNSPELGEYLNFSFDEPDQMSVATPAARLEEQGTEIHQVIKIQLTDSNGNGTATINLNLADLILRNPKSKAPTTAVAKLIHGDSIEEQSKYNNNDTTLVEDDRPQHRSKRIQLLHDVKAQKAKAKSSKTGFTDLPYELRIGIYRRVLVREAPLDFVNRRGFCRSSQFLRTCKLVSEEGRAVLYSENSFHFSRSPATRGAFYETQWKEVGFKDVRRFLEMIGTENIALLKYVSFDLRDAAPSATPYLDEEERRCVNDPILHYIFNTIGAHTVLEKLYIEFDFRRQVLRTDYFFLKSLANMKCFEFKHAVGYWVHRRRLPSLLLQNLKKVMVVKKEINDDVDLSKKKTSSPRMTYSSSDHRHLL